MNNGCALQATLGDDENKDNLDVNCVAFSANCDNSFLAIDFTYISHINEHCATSLNDLTNPCSNMCSEDESNDQANYLALGISFNSDDESNDSICSNENTIKECNLQDSFNCLMEKFTVLRKENLRSLEDVRSLELEKSKLLNDLGDSHAIYNTLKSENHVLITKVKSLEKELDESRNHFKKISSKKLDDMLKNQKSSCDKTGLGFDKVAASSNHASSSKIIFVKSQNVEETNGEEKPEVAPSSNKRGKEVKAKKKEKASPTSNGKKGKNGEVHPTKSPLPKNKFNHVHPSQRVARTCHHCGKIGHIRPNCFKLKPHEHKRKTCYFRNDFKRIKCHDEDNDDKVGQA
ncbi:uncharacterized protein LOC132162924 [Corylus avellana]|uniref:uncharacterized protein LOC132162924 n=1 Tax=Corylus avellana TaxID=13451 RepID=UPI00286C1096|nr:uncharacterized protein LOC132162924 [Corylus avellana]